MDVVSYTAFRQNLAMLMDQVNENHQPLLVTRQNGLPAVVLSLEDFKAYEETAYLMASPRNAQRLAASIEELRAGQGVTRNLLDDDPEVV